VIVADTNLIVYTVVTGPFTADAHRVMQIDEEWLAPPLWQSEFLNVLWLMVRQGVISHTRADEVCSLAQLLVRTTERPAPTRALALASGYSPYSLRPAEQCPKFFDHIGVVQSWTRGSKCRNASSVG
jgi:predicted nucleic acid-binding protein